MRAPGLCSPAKLLMLVIAPLLMLAGIRSAPAFAQIVAYPLYVTISASPGTAQPGQTVTFGYSIVNPNAGDPLRGIFIDFGDGSNQQLPTVPPSGTATHSYSNPGTYTATASAQTIGQISGQSTTTVVVGTPTRTFPAYVPPAPGSTCNWSGTWDAGVYGTMRLNQVGNQVTGSYAYFGDPPTYTLIQGTLSGTLSGNTVNGTYYEPPVYVGSNVGTFAFTMSPTCGQFTGNWAYPTTPPGSWDGTWNANRVG